MHAQSPSVSQCMLGPTNTRLQPWGCRLSGFSETLVGSIRRLEVAQPRVKLILGFTAPYGLSGAGREARCQAFVVSRPEGPVVVQQSGVHSMGRRLSR